MVVIIGVVMVVVCEVYVLFLIEILFIVMFFEKLFFILLSKVICKIRIYRYEYVKEKLMCIF